MQTENPGYYHRRIGDLTVTALNDGVLTGSTEIFLGIPPDEAGALIEAAYRPLPPRLTVNAFLLRSGDHIALIDTGTGAAAGPTLGFVPKRLATLGLAPEQVQTILLTHLHIDHAAGLVDAEDRARYPNAELVMHEGEASWLDEANETRAPEGRRPAYALARRVTKPYAGRIRQVTGGEVLPGVTIEPLPGHTPGHSGYLIQSSGESLLIWADIIHMPPLQFPHPEIGLVFDSDPDQARETRARLLDRVATDRMLVAGMHLDFPTFGHVERAATGYAFIPEVWAP